MFFKKSSLGRAALLAVLVVFLSVFVTSCQPATSYPGYIQIGNIRAYNLTAKDPICGSFTGNMGDAFFTTDIAFSAVASATNLPSVDGKSEGTYLAFSVFDWNKYDYVDTYFEKDSYPVYVVYNKFDDSDSLDKHSGVIIYRTKYSPSGYPRVGSYYGIKFQFLVDDDKVPEIRTASTQYTDKLLIEGAYNNDDVILSGWTVTGYKNENGYNTVSTLEEAVTKFAFNNTEVFGSSAWTWSSSGAQKK